MPPQSAEGNVVRNYIDWILSLPWGEKSECRVDIDAAEKIRTGSLELKRATEGQQRSIEQIAFISRNVSNQARQINNAIDGQKQMSYELAFAMEKIQKTTAELISSATEMDSHIQSLSKDAKTLLAEIQKFTV